MSKANKILKEYHDDERPRESTKCKDCGRSFTPDGDNETYCSRCNAAYELKKEREYEEGDYED